MHQFLRYFADRKEAGKKLADKLKQYKNKPNVIVVGLPRGGVPVAAQVAQTLHVPLDVIVARKVGAPLQPELALGAVTADGSVVYNRDLMSRLGLKPEDLADQVTAKKAEAKSRATRFRAGKPPLNLHGKTVIVVDDGIATGATARAAIQSARNKGAARIVFAVPVAPDNPLLKKELEVDELVVVLSARDFPAVGFFYQQFEQVADETVERILSAFHVRS